jgi:putative transcriptional regulator
MTHTFAYDALMLDHAAGTLDPAATLVMNAHARLAARGRHAALLGDVLGGALLEAMTPAPLHATPLGQGEELADAPWPLDHAPEARAENLILLAQSDPGSLNWRWRWFGVRVHDLPVAGARLLRMKPSASAPRHSHAAYELTLVLEGRYADERAEYGVGDLAIAVPGDTHRPRTLATEGCLCLTANVGPGAASAARMLLDKGRRNYILYHV